MTDSTRHPEGSSDDGTDLSGGAPPRMPRWVKLTGIIVGVLIVLILLLRLAGVGGEHGPGRHMSGAEAPSASLVAAHVPLGVDRG